MVSFFLSYKTNFQNDYWFTSNYIIIFGKFVVDFVLFCFLGRINKPCILETFVVFIYFQSNFFLYFFVLFCWGSCFFPNFLFRSLDSSQKRKRWCTNNQIQKRFSQNVLLIFFLCSFIWDKKLNEKAIILNIIFE